MDQQPVVKRESTFPLFSKHFNNHPQDVIDYFHTMRRQMQDFIDAFKKRIDVQITYSKNLQNVSKTLDKYIKPGTQLSTSYICSAFKVQHEQRSRQAHELAQSLKTQIESMCSQYLKNQALTLKKMEKDIKKFYKDAQNYTDNHIRAFSSFQGISRDMEQTIITKNIMRYTTGIPQQKKVKLIGKASESIKQNKEYEKLYLNSVKEYNSFVSAYNKQITLQLDQAESLIRQQIILQGDCLRKLIVAEVSMFKNIQYDLLNISKQMEYLDTQKDVEMFVSEHKNNVHNKIALDQRKQKEGDIKLDTVVGGCILQEKSVVGKSMLSESIFYIQEEYFSWMLSNKKNKQLRELIGRIWRILKNQLNTQLKVESKLNSIGKLQQEIQQMSSKQQNSPNLKVQISVQEQQTLNEPKQQTKQQLKQQPKQQQKQQITSQIKQQIKQQRKQQIKQQSKQQLKQQPKYSSWQQQLKQTILAFKILQPPTFLTSNQKKEKGPNHQKIYQIFMQITSTIALLWNSQEINEQTLNIKLNTLQNYLSEHHLYRLITLIFIEEYRIQHEVIIKSPNNAKICGKIIRVVLRESHKKNDVFIIRGFLGLIFTFYWIDDKINKLLYLIPEICQCDIWKRTDFWQASIFETTFEQMSLFSVQKGETPQQTIERQKNIIFSQLASYCHYMIMMSMTSKIVRLTVGRYCRLYQMTEQQNKDLSKMINNTIKQYKQTVKGTEREKSVIVE